MYACTEICDLHDSGTPHMREFIPELLRHDSIYITRDGGRNARRRKSHMIWKVVRDQRLFFFLFSSHFLVHISFWPTYIFTTGKESSSFLGNLKIFTKN